MLAEMKEFKELKEVEEHAFPQFLEFLEPLQVLDFSKHEGKGIHRRPFRSVHRLRSWVWQSPARLGIPRFGVDLSPSGTYPCGCGARAPPLRP